MYAKLKHLLYEICIIVVGLYEFNAKSYKAVKISRSTWDLFQFEIVGVFIQIQKMNFWSLAICWYTGHKENIFFQHDTTLWSMVAALGLFRNQSMPYSTCIMVELHKDGTRNQTKDYSVRMYQRDGLTAVTSPLILPGTVTNVNILF